MSDIDASCDNEVAIKRAKKKGFAIIRTAPNLLLLDLDDEVAYQHYLDIFPVVKEYIGVEKIGEWRSKSGEGWHIVLQTDRKLPIRERMLLQAIFGSDLKRELYNLVRVWNKDEDAIVLFKPRKKGKFSSPVKNDD